MSVKHLAKGSALPPKKEGVLRLYSMFLCPYAQRARIILKLKNVPHDIVNIDLKNKPEWFLELNPEGKVPALDTGSQIISESLAISDYLDETYPEPPLYPKDPASIEKDKELIKSFDGPSWKFFGAFLNKENLSLAARFEEALPDIQRLEDELSKRGKFFGGDTPKMADYMIWPWVERIGVLPRLYNDKVPISEDSFPRIRAWYAAMQKQPVNQEVQTDIESFHKLLLQYKAGSTVTYDEI